jgi:hypothetical protein
VSYLRQITLDPVELQPVEGAAAAGAAKGSLNGTSAVTIVAAPGTGFMRRVESVRFVNIDTAAVDIRLRLTVAGPTNYECDCVIALAVDGKFFPVEGSDVIWLGTTDSLTAVMGGAAATTNPTWVSGWVDVPVPV